MASRYLSDSPQQKPTPSIQNPDKGTGTSSGGGFRQQATSLLSRYGCGGSTLRIDDPRLPSHANGAYDFNTGQVLLKSSMPAYRMEYVVAHECMHQRQSRAYGGDINDLSRDMNAIYGGSGYTGLERNADCMTKSLGISVSNSQYASSCSGVGGRAAQAILAGKRP